MPTTLTLLFLGDIAARLLLDALALAVLVGGLYRSRRTEYAFSYVVTNIVTLCTMVLMSSSDMGIGLGLGLLAIFGIFRYRTKEVDVVDLSYLFAAVGLAVVNGFTNGMQLWVAGALDVAIIFAIGLAELARSYAGGPTQRLVYDRLDLLAPARGAELQNDLASRLGVSCDVVGVGNVDLLRETAVLYVRMPKRSW